MLSALEADGCWPSLDAVLTGYFPSPQAVEAAAEAIVRIKAAKPGITVLVDPVLGDARRLYVAPATAEAIRDALLPLATIATPNLFELGWLSGTTLNHPAEAVQAARHLGPPTVVVTSASETTTIVATLLVSKDKRIEREMPKHAGIPNGAGDLFAGLFLGHSLNGRSGEAALDASLADLGRVLAANAAGCDVLQLAALQRDAPAGLGQFPGSTSTLGSLGSVFCEMTSIGSVAVSTGKSLRIRSRKRLSVYGLK